MSTKKPCDCIERMNAHLMAKGRTLAMRPLVNFQTDREVCDVPLLKTENLSDPKPKGPAPMIYGKFCPFCGQALFAGAMP